jgi:exopolysaccharide biosynthesis polyprenyl glycosylphosphotransferase
MESESSANIPIPPDAAEAAASQHPREGHRRHHGTHTQRLYDLGPARSWPRWTESDFLTDISMLAVATLAALAGSDLVGVAIGVSAWTLTLPFVVLASLAAFGLYRPRLATSFLDDVPKVIAATSVATMALSFFQVLLLDNPDAAREAAALWALSTGLLLAGRGGLALTERRALAVRDAGHPTLIVGAGRVGRLIARRLLDKPEVGLRPVGFVDDDPLSDAGLDPADLGTQSLPIYGTGPALDGLVRNSGVEHAIIGFSSASHASQLALARRLHELGVTVSVVPRLFEAIPDRVVPQRTVGLPLVSIFPSNPRSWRMSLKYALDRGIAVLAVAVLSPLFLGTTIAVLASLGRPIFYRQRRVGLDGREFEMLKFRTMRARASAEEPADEALGEFFQRGLGPGGVEGDDRRTRVGALLRRTGLDELPQVFNVVRGEMSIVGPRPEREELVPWFEREVHRYEDRHRVRPGITGWAQVHGLRGKTSLTDRVEWDNYYIENWSPWLDLKILLLTLAAPFHAGIE